MRNLFLWLVLLPYSVLVGAESTLSIEKGYVRGLPPTQKISAAFVTLVNRGMEPITLQSVTGTWVEQIEFHGHVKDQGMMGMRQFPSLAIPAQGQLSLRPGGYHLMLMGLKEPLQDGQTVVMNFRFSNGETLVKTLPVFSVLNEPQYK